MHTFVTSAEAAYIANLSDRQIHRMIDEKIVPAELFNQDGDGRQFTRLYAALAEFYYKTEPIFQPAARRQVVHEVTSRVHASPISDRMFDLAVIDNTDSILIVEIKGYHITVEPYVARCSVRAKEVDQADALVQANDQILGGTPVFLGTRLPIENVLGALTRGSTVASILDEYPYLTPVHIEAARVYAAVHPRRGRPPRVKTLHPDMTVKAKGVLRAARA